MPTRKQTKDTTILINNRLSETDQETSFLLRGGKKAK